MSDIKNSTEYSLKSIIEMQFVDNVKDVGGNLELINSYIATLSNNLKEFNQSKETFNLKISKLVESAVSDIKNNSKVKVDGSVILNKLQKKIAKAALNIKFVDSKGRDLDLEDVPMNIAVKGNVWKNVEKKFSKELNKLLLNANIDFSKTPRIKIPSYLFERATDEVAKQVYGFIGEHVRIDFSVNRKKLPKLELTSPHFKSVLNTVSNAIINHLKDPNNVELKGIPKLQIKSSMINEIISSLKTSIKDVNSQLRSTASVIKQLPQMDTSLSKLQESMNKVAGQLNSIDEEIKKLSSIDEDNIQVTKIVESVNYIKDSIIDSLYGFVYSLTKEIKNSTFISTIDLSSTRKVLNEIKVIIDNYVSSYLDSVTAGLYEQIGVQFDANNKIFIPSIQKLQERISQATEQAFEELRKSDLKIDFDVTKTALNKWGEVVSSKIQEQIDSTIPKLTTKILEEQQVIFDTFVNSIINTVKFKLKVKDNKNIDIKIDTEKLQGDVRKQLQKIVTLMTSNVSFTDMVGGGEQVDQIKLTIPPKVISKISKDIMDMLIKHSEAFTKQLIDKQSIELPNTDIKNLNKTIYNETKQIVDVVIAEAVKAVSSISESIETKGLKTVTADDKRAVKELFNKHYSDIIRSYINSLEVAVGAITMVATVSDQLKGEILSATKNLDDSMKKTFDGIKFLSQVQQEAYDSFNRYISSWIPNLQEFKVDTNIQEVLNPIRIAIDEMLDRIVLDIVAGIKSVTESINVDKLKTIDEEFIRQSLNPIRDSIIDHIKSYAVFTQEFVKTVTSGLSNDTVALNLETTVKQIKKKIEKLFSKAKTDIDDYTVDLKLQAAVVDIQSKIKAAVDHAIELYEPLNDIKEFSFNLVEGILEPIERVIQQLINELGQNLKAEVANRKSKKVVGDMDSVKIEESPYSINSKDLHPDVKKKLAKVDGLSVKEWTKANRELTGVEVLEQIANASVSVVTDKFHEAVVNQITSSIKKYQSVFDGLSTEHGEVTNYFIKKLGTKVDEITKTFILKMTDHLEQTFNSILSHMDEIYPKYQSIGFDVSVKRKEKGEEKEPPMSSIGYGDVPVDIKEEGTEKVNEVKKPELVKDINGILGLPPANKGGLITADLSINFDERYAKILAEKTKNRYMGKVDETSYNELLNFLKYYLKKVSQLSVMPTGTKESAKAVSDGFKILYDELRMFTTMLDRDKYFQGGEVKVDDMRRRVSEFSKNAILNANALKIKLFDSLSKEQNDYLDTELYNKYLKPVEEFANTPIMNIEDVKKVKRQFSEFNLILKEISERFTRIAKQSKLETDVDKLQGRFDRLISDSLLPVNKLQKLNDLISNIYNKDSLNEAKKYYADLVKEQRVLATEQRNNLKDQESFEKRKADLQVRQSLYANQEKLKADSLISKLTTSLDPFKMWDLNSQITDYLNKVNEVATKPITSEDDLKHIQQRMRELRQELVKIGQEWETSIKLDKFNYDISKLTDKLRLLREAGLLDSGKLNNVEDLIGKATNVIDVNKIKQELAKLTKEQNDIIRTNRQLEFFNNKAADVDMQRRVFERASMLSTDKLRFRFETDLSPEEFQNLQNDLSEFERKVKDVQNMSLLNMDEVRLVREQMALLNKEISEIALKYKNLVRNETFSIKKEKLYQQRDWFKENGFLPAEDIERFSNAIDSAVTTNDLRRVDMMISELKRLEKVYKELATVTSKRGELIHTDELLKLQNISETLMTSILKTVPAFEGYRIKQVQVNNATNTWSASLEDALGNIKKLQGTINKVTGELYQHAAVLNMVSDATKGLEYIPVPTKPAKVSSRGSYDPMSGFFPVTENNDGKYSQPGLFGQRGSFLGSIVNTMRYITAGAIVGMPYMMYNQAWESARETDYLLEKARQNFMVKYYDPKTGKYDLTSVAQRRIADYERSTGKKSSLTEQQVATQFLDYIKVGAVRDIQDIAIANAIDQVEVSKAFHIASRRYDDPYEARAFAEQIAKLHSVEEIDVEKAAAGFEAISSQWGVGGYDMKKIANMLIVASNISQATVDDLIATQQRSGAIFRENLPGMSKEQALATSIALSSMFIQSTARSGSEGGTFFRSILTRPYTKEGQKALVELSQRKGFEELNPYYIDENGVKKQKDFISVLSSILETSLKLDDASKKELWSAVVPKWHEGSFEAMGTFMQDLQADLERTKNIFNSKGEGVSIKDAIENYINQIKSASDEQVALMRAGMADTWKFRTGRLSSQWTSSVYQVFEELKDEFGELTTYISAILRIIRENASGFAELVTFLGKIGVVLGGRFAYSKVKELYVNVKSKKLADKYNEASGLMLEEGRIYNLEKMDVASRMSDIQRRKDSVLEKRIDKTNQYNKKVDLMRDLSAMVDTGQLEIDELIRSGVPADNQQIIDKQKSVDSMREQYAKEEQELKKLRKQIEGLDNAEAILTKRLGLLGEEMADVDRKTQGVRNRMSALGLAMEDQGVDASKLNRNIDALNTTLSMGIDSMTSYDNGLSKLGAESNRVSGRVSPLRRELDRLNKEFTEGRIDAHKYIEEVKKLERIKLQQSLNIGSETGGGALFGNSLMDTAITASLFKGLISKGKGTGGLLSKGLDLFKNIPLIGSLVGKSTSAGGILGELTKGSKLLGNLSKVKNLIKVVPDLGWLLLGFDLIETVTDPFMAHFMTEPEKLSIQATNIKQLADRTQSMDAAAWYNPMKYVEMLSFGWDMTLDSVKHMLGGNAPSFNQYWEALTAALSKDGEELKKQLSERLNYEGLEAKAQVAQMMLDRAHELDRDGDGLIDSNIREGSATISTEDASAIINRITEQLGWSMQDNETNYQVDRVKMIVNGIRQDSKEMRDLTKKYLTTNLKFLEDAIAELETNRNYINPDTEQYKMLLDQENQLKMQKAQVEEQIFTTDLSEIQAVVDKMNRNVALEETKYDLSYYKALNSGVAEDSAQLKAINESKMRSVNSVMEQGQSELRALLKKYEGTDVWTDIWLQIQQIEVDQAKNLQEIRKQLEKSMSTFNLPAGITPMTYYEYMTKNNSHKNVSVNSGGVVVNVTIDNMSGSTKDIEKLTSEIRKSITKAQQNFVNQFSNNVVNGTGAQYKTW